MIIRKVKLTPFGAAANREYSFLPGLNVLLGANEAGKTTLVKGLLAAFFVPANVKRSADDWKNLVSKCLPYPHGDTARVVVDFEDSRGGSYSYRCSWGGKKEESLLVGDGSEINDAATIREHLHSFLGYGRGTYQGVLFARQEEMLDTVERLKEIPEAARTITGLLRAALFESGGVPLEELEDAFRVERERLLQNWDESRNEPNGGRGIDNRYRRGVGEILAAYYKSESLRLQLREACASEEQVGTLTEVLEKKSAELEELVIRLKKMERLEEEARLRSSLEPRLDSLSLREEELKKVISQWPRSEEKVKHLHGQLELNRRQLTDLEQELQEAAAASDLRKKQALLEKVRPLQSEIILKEEELNGLPRVTQEDLSFLNYKQQNWTNMKAALEGMKLQLIFRSEKPVKLKLSSGLGEPEQLIVDKETASWEGAGRMQLTGPDWTLVVQSGDGDVENMIEKSREAAEAIENKLLELSVKDINEVRAARIGRDRLEKTLEGLRSRLSAILGEENIAALEVAVAASRELKPVREAESLREEIGKLHTTCSNLHYQVQQEQEKLQQWEEQYLTLDEAVDTLAEMRGESRGIRSRLEKLSALPEGFSSGNQFIAALKEMREQRNLLVDETARLHKELFLAQSRMPEESTEELEGMLKQSREELERLKEKGRALRAVEAEFHALKEELDGSTLEPLTRSFTAYLAPLTNFRYAVASMQGALPSAIGSAEGKKLPLELLSAGTAGGLALALRLSMADELLKGRAGFMVMDDPLINMDPSRKKQAAEVLKSFAREKQLIITTFDPATASLLGGNLIEM